MAKQHEAVHCLFWTWTIISAVWIFTKWGSKTFPFFMLTKICCTLEDSSCFNRLHTVSFTITTAASHIGLTGPDGFSKRNLPHRLSQCTDKHGKMAKLSERVWMWSQIPVDTSGLILTRTLNPAAEPNSADPWYSSLMFFALPVRCLSHSGQKYRTWFYQRITDKFATSTYFLCYFSGNGNGKMYHIPLTKSFMHIYTYLWRSNPIKRVSITLLFWIYHNKKYCISQKYATVRNYVNASRLQSNKHSNVE